MPAKVLKELIAFFNTFQALPREKSSNLLANCKVILMITDNDVDYFKIVEENARNWLYNFFNGPDFFVCSFFNDLVGLICQ